MPQSEKLKLRAELQIPEKEEREMQLDDWKILASQIHEAYLKQFHLNKAKARGFLIGKTNMPVSISSPLICTLLLFFFTHLHQVLSIPFHINSIYKYIIISMCAFILV